MLHDYCVNERQTIKDAIAVIQSNFSRCAIIINDQSRVIGVFSEGDVLRAILRDFDLHSPLKSVITSQFVFLKRRDIPAAFEIFCQRGISLLPVIDDDFQLVDVITAQDMWSAVTLLSTAQ